MRLIVVLALVILVAPHRQVVCADSAATVQVRQVKPASGGAAAGLVAGDLLIAWRPARSARTLAAKAGESKPLTDSIAFDRLDSVHNAFGDVTLDIRRNGEPQTVVLRQGEWGVTVGPVAERPRTEREALSLRTEAAMKLFTAHRYDDAVRELQEAANSANGELRAWVQTRLAELLRKRNRPVDALDVLRSALALEDAESLFAAHLLVSMSAIARSRQAFDDAEKWANQALTIQNAEAPDSAEPAIGLLAVGQVATARRQYDRAEEALKRGLAIAERIAPGSRIEADLLEAIGLIAQRLGQIDVASSRYEQTMRIRERVEPRSIDHANAYNNLAVIASIRGDLPRAAELYSPASAILLEENPDGLDTANLLNNMGILEMLRGDYEKAETALRRSLEIKKQLGADLGMPYHNLGILAVEQRDLPQAAHYFEQSLELKRRFTPESEEIPASLSTLAGVERQRGRLAEAEALAREALTLRRARMAGTLELGFTLTELGRILEREGRHPEAAAMHREALAIREGRAPNSTSVAETLDLLASLAETQGNVAEALPLQERSAAIWSRLTPGSLNEAAAHLALGKSLKRAGEHERSLIELQRAVDALEVQSGRLGATQEAAAGFRASIGGFYAALIEALLERQQTADAFHVLERSRARAFLALLAERDVAFGGDVPEALDRARKIAARQYDEVQWQLTQQNPESDHQTIEELLGRLQDLRRQQAEIARNIRQQSPRLAALQYPDPLGAEAAAAGLDTGVAMLAYVVDAQQSWVFVLGGDTSVRARRLAIGAEELRGRVERFRHLIERGRVIRDMAPLEQPARELYQLLIGPVEDLLSSATRIVIVPDGPLHVLPFAALLRQDAPDRAPQYLASWRPLHTVSSATVYRELRGLGSAPTTPIRLVAFGDPWYRAANGQAAPAFEPLPGTRREVEAIARSVGDRTEVHLGTDASERLAVTRMAAGQYVHVALHGISNDRLPLNAALAFATPATPSSDDDGLLHAWEVFERVRLHADLVVLSACETGLGAEFGPEGMLGLTRAFQYAGAPMVLSSLWRVPDDATARLMASFYASLAKRRPVDVALADAQNALRADPEFRHPFFWAGMVLNGHPH